MHRTQTSGTDPRTGIFTTGCVHPGSAVAWLGAGWSYFMRMTAPLAVLSVTLLGAALLTSTRVGAVLFPAAVIFYLGIVAGYCRTLDQGEQVPCDHAQVYGSASLWIVAAVASAVALGLRRLGETIGAPALAPSWLIGEHFGRPDLYFLAVIALTLLACMAFCMAPALVILNGANPLRAICLSLLGSLKNVVPLLAFFVLTGALLILGILPLGAGLIVAMPVAACGTFKAYEKIFN
ncbi:hypothetical protein [Massilia horti]|uniref:Transmembrane protein n=1 Tax=Massilia horti TaxID=2562153 RepID=A0A4Y9SN37_9BURK|nr:hypothetical protein [Massilia horti]TFW27958.1 hypothetical protein E4O92_22610 [Massilia horti]